MLREATNKSERCGHCTVSQLSKSCKGGYGVHVSIKACAFKRRASLGHT